MSFNLDDLDSLTKLIYLERHWPKDYETFVKRLKLDVQEAIANIEENANLYKACGEDILTSLIVSYLKACKYSATQDENFRGHVDIKVKQNQFVWLAEAKIWKAHAWLLKGMAQLINRYSTGKPNQNHGALIIYYPSKNIQEKMRSWKSFLEGSALSDKHKNIKERLGTTTVNCRIDNELYFESIHIHENTGQDYIVWHVPVVLHYNPSDPDM